jgi:hypothetical protein
MNLYWDPWEPVPTRPISRYGKIMLRHFPRINGTIHSQDDAVRGNEHRSVPTAGDGMNVFDTHRNHCRLRQLHPKLHQHRRPGSRKVAEKIDADPERDYEAAFDEVVRCYKGAFSPELQLCARKNNAGGRGVVGFPRFSGYVRDCCNGVHDRINGSVGPATLLFW